MSNSAWIINISLAVCLGWYLTVASPRDVRQNKLFFYDERNHTHAHANAHAHTYTQGYVCVRALAGSDNLICSKAERLNNGIQCNTVQYNFILPLGKFI